MAISNNFQDRDKQSFGEDTKGNTARYTIDERIHKLLKEKLPNNVIAVRTDITSGSAKKIELPEDCEQVWIYHLTTGEFVYVGNTSSITSSADSAPIESGYRLVLKLKSGNDNELYGIASGGTVTVFAIGVFRG